jgi:hypothetical protein
VRQRSGLIVAWAPVVAWDQPSGQHAGVDRALIGAGGQRTGRSARILAGGWPGRLPPRSHPPQRWQWCPCVLHVPARRLKRRDRAAAPRSSPSSRALPPRFKRESAPIARSWGALRYAGLRRDCGTKETAGVGTLIPDVDGASAPGAPGDQGKPRAAAQYFGLPIGNPAAARIVPPAAPPVRLPSASQSPRCRPDDVRR